MLKVKRKYSVYYIGKGTGCYAQDYCKIYLGDTWAVSKEKACSNVRYRNRNKELPNGGYKNDILSDYAGEGVVSFEYEAEEI